MTKRPYLSAWKSPAAEQRFRELEDALVRDLVAEPPAPLDVETRLGPTRAYRWRGDGVPVVYLHGTAGTSLTWARYAEARGGRDMYAIDTIGDVGRSRQQLAVECADDLASWLDETLAHLELQRVHLAGTSYGGFLALNLAVRKRERVRSLCLIEPAGIVPVRLLRFMLWGSLALFASRLPIALRRVAARRLRMPAVEDARVMRLALYGQLHHRSRLLPPPLLSDEQLRSIHQPVLLFVGEKSEVFSVRALTDRAEAALTAADVRIVTGAGHAVSWSNADHIAREIGAFVARHDAATARHG